jgi:hypothetical protein
VKLSIELTDGKGGPGAWVRGRVTVVEGGGARELRVALQYRESSPHYTHVAFDGPPQLLHSGELTDGQAFDFALFLPADAFPSLKMRHSELYWAACARCDRRGPDAEAHTRIG